MSPRCHSRVQLPGSVRPGQTLLLCRPAAPRHTPAHRQDISGPLPEPCLHRRAHCVARAPPRRRALLISECVEPSCGETTVRLSNCGETRSVVRTLRENPGPSELHRCTEKAWSAGLLVWKPPASALMTDRSPNWPPFSAAIGGVTMSAPVEVHAYRRGRPSLLGGWIFGHSEFRQAPGKNRASDAPTGYR